MNIFESPENNDPRDMENVFHPHEPAPGELPDEKIHNNPKLEKKIEKSIIEQSEHKKKRLLEIQTEREKAIDRLDEINGIIGTDEEIHQAISKGLAEEEERLRSERENINKYIHELDFERDQLENFRED
ncbi:MAG: hypothetical protein WC795_02400 [Candidatus Paceibacterota bacterium]|jgi:flagellar biosynthesis/type III secretory pathway protein FliH